jgi:hypothetical protein
LIPVHGNRFLHLRHARAGDDAELTDRRADPLILASIRLRELAAEVVDLPLGAVDGSR